MIRKLATAALLASAALGARPAHAFLIVGTDAAQQPGPRTHVVLLREDGRSVVAVAPTVRGPARPLAIVVPLQATVADTLHTVPATLFDRADSLAAPRLDELWELDPCELHPNSQVAPAASSASAAPSGSAAPAPTIDGNYEISLLSEADSANAASWLTDRGYKLGEAAQSALVAAAKPGTVFAVARIDGARLTFDEDVARLPPLAFVVNGQVSIPLRLAGVGATANHEVIVDVLAPRARFEAASQLNLAVPTNLDVKEATKENPDGLYRAVLDYAFEKTPRAAITEYAWLAASCDGCAGGHGVSAEDLLALGAERLPSAEDGSQREVLVDVPEALARAPEGPPALKRSILACYGKVLADMRGLAGEATVVVQTGAKGEVTSAKIKDASAEALGRCVEDAARATTFDRPNASDVIKARFALVARAYLGELVLTRLRVRSSAGTAADLELRAAAAIEGGREEGPTGSADKKVYFAEHTNNFQARYTLRHPWPGPIACESPRRGVWGAKPKNQPSSPARPTSSASASATPSGKPAAPSAAEAALASLLEGDALPDLQSYTIAFRAAEPPRPAAATPPSGTASSASPGAASSAPGGQTRSGDCGCRVAAPGAGAGAWLAITAIIAIFRGIRRRIH